MTNQELLAALRRMAPETGSLHCLGCGYEHNCSLHGCAIIREAAEAIRVQQPAAKLERRRFRYCPECDPECRGCQTCVYAARREELEPCKSCVKRYADSEGMESPGYVDANYCAYCGHPLTEAAWAELEGRIGGNNGTTDY